MNIACIIPSKNPDNLLACVSAVRLNDPGVRIIVVDDSDGGMAPICAERGITCVKGEKPFVWARNINIGIRAAGEADGVVLLNDDAVLETPDGFSRMAEIAVKHASGFEHWNFKYCGVLSAAIRGAAAATEQIYRGGDGFRKIEHHMMAFVAVYVPAYALKEIGMLDERYTEYGYDDDDYCKRVTDAGYALGVFDGCVVEHGSKPSTFRSRPGTSLQPNHQKFIEKWGHAPGKVPTPSLAR